MIDGLPAPLFLPKRHYCLGLFGASLGPMTGSSIPSGAQTLMWVVLGSLIRPQDLIPYAIMVGMARRPQGSLGYLGMSCSSCGGTPGLSDDFQYFHRLSSLVLEEQDDQDG